MVKKNDAIAIIIIVLFIILTLIAIGIYHLVRVARRNFSGTVTGSSSSSGSSSSDDLHDGN